MKKLSVIFLLLNSWLLMAQPYQQYYQYINEAELATVDHQYAVAIDFYQQAFTINTVNPQHLLAAGKCHLQIKQDSLAFALFRQAVEKGYLLEYLTDDIVEMGLSTTIFWQRLKEEYPTLRQEFIATVPVDIFLKLSNMKAVDVYTRSRVSSSIFVQIARKSDSTHLFRLKEITEQYGFPGRNVLGAGSHNTFLILLHGMDVLEKGSAEWNYWETLLRQEIMTFNIDPGTVASILERPQWRAKQPRLYGIYNHYLDIEKKQFSPIHDINRVDERRQALGLESLADMAKKQGLTLPADYPKP